MSAPYLALFCPAWPFLCSFIVCLLIQKTIQFFQDGTIWISLPWRVALSVSRSQCPLTLGVCHEVAFVEAINL